MKTILKQAAAGFRRTLHDPALLITVLVLFFFLRFLNGSEIALIRARGISLAEVVFQGLQSMNVVALLYVPLFLLLCRELAPAPFDLFVLPRSGVCGWSGSRVVLVLLQALAFASLLALLVSLSVFPAWLWRNEWALDGFLLGGQGSTLSDSLIYSMTPLSCALVQWAQLACLFVLLGLLADLLTLLFGQRLGMVTTFLVQFLLYGAYWLPLPGPLRWLSYRCFFLSEYGSFLELLAAGGAALAFLTALTFLCQAAARRYKWYAVKRT